MEQVKKQLELTPTTVELKASTVTRVICLKEDETLLCVHKFSYPITRWCSRTGRRITDYNQIHSPHQATEVIQLDNGEIASGGHDGTIALWRCERVSDEGSISSSSLRISDVSELRYLKDEEDSKKDACKHEDEDDEDYDEEEARRRRWIESQRPRSIQRLVQGMEDKRILYSLSSSLSLATIKVWRLDTLRVTQRISIDCSCNYLCEVSPRLLVTDFYDKDLALWETDATDDSPAQTRTNTTPPPQQHSLDPALVGMFPSAHSSYISSIVRLSPGKFATSSFDTYIKLWMVEESHANASNPTFETEIKFKFGFRRLSDTFSKHLEEIYSLSLVSDHQQELLVSCSKDESVRLWEIVNNSLRCVNLCYCSDRPNLVCKITSSSLHRQEIDKIAIALYGFIKLYQLSS
eukprot:TRINITY_DN2170_c0_g2_i1.p1 TRINITY_DN2170_c0_g2~~TRINITY_DN2170_c0_g2_i1.p1  ORF type:complete len:407 (+),score=61.46 TRINITY_DN2170_c0_g2_i1:171-1391(+)